MNERDLWRLSRGLSDSTEGVVTVVDFPNRLVTVNCGGVTKIIPWSGPAPWVGDRVRVVKNGQSAYCEAVYGSAIGTIASVGTDVVTVTGDDGVTYSSYSHAFGASYSAGQRVVLNHASRSVMHRLSTDPSGYVGDTNASPDSDTVTRTFRPTSSSNWFTTYSRWDSQYVDVSDNRSGYYFYGNQIASSIPDSATILSAKISIREVWDNLSGIGANMGRHSAGSRPGSGPIALTGSVDVNASGTYDITSWGDDFKTGAAKGVGFAQASDWCRFDTYARSGAITIKWRT